MKPGYARLLRWLRFGRRNPAARALQRMVRATIRSARLCYQILSAAARRFLADNCAVRANAIAYAIVVSIIPLMTVLVRLADVDREAISDYVAQFLAAYGLTDTSQIINMLDEILARSNAITGVGVIFMIYAAASLLQYLESSFNHIYKARKQRPLVFRFSLYISSLVLLPTIIGLSYSGSRYLLNEIRPAELTDIAANGRDAYWVSGSNGILRRIDPNDASVERVDLRKKTDVRTPYRDVYFDVNTGRAGPAWETRPQGAPPAGAVLESADFFGLQAIAAGGGRIYVISETGALFYSEDNGRSWLFDKLLMIGEEDASPDLRDLFADDQGRVTILAQSNRRSLLIFRTPGAARGAVEWDFRLLDGLYFGFHRIDDVAPDAEGPAQNGLYLAGRGQYRFSPEGPELGRAWTGPIAERFGNQSVDILSIESNPAGELFFAGKNGAVWIRTGADLLIPDLRADFGENVRRVHMDANGRGFLYGSAGLFRITFDDGRSWQRPEPRRFGEREFYAHQVLDSDPNSFLLAGDNATALLAGPASLSDELDPSGRRYASLETRTLTHFTGWKSIALGFFLNAFVFLLLFGIFVAAYVYIPNAKVDWRAAAVGGGITSVALLAFIMGFRSWVSGSTITGYIYGVWAALPLGMLVILASTQIILFGLEVAYVIQHPYLYRGRNQTREKFEAEGDSLLWDALLLLSHVYHSLYQNKRPLTDEQALRFFKSKVLKLEYARERLEQAALLSYDGQSGEYFPVRPPDDIKIADVQALILEGALRLPNHGASPGFRAGVEELQGRILEQVRRVSDDASIADFIPLLEQDPGGDPTALNARRESAKQARGLRARLRRLFGRDEESNQRRDGAANRNAVDVAGLSDGGRTPDRKATKAAGKTRDAGSNRAGRGEKRRTGAGRKNRG